VAFLKKVAIIEVLILTFWLTQVSAQVPEYQVKAAMLYKFALFVEWPAEAFPSDTSPFIVCVLGTDPFGPWLQQEVGETRVGSHPVEISYADNEEALPQCHLVFLSRFDQFRINRLVNSLSKENVLIVGDASDINKFCRLGGMVGLVMEGNKVRFVFNSNAIENAGLKVDSRLKRLAKSVDCGRVP
jgi:hypothetical protein